MKERCHSELIFLSPTCEESHRNNEKEILRGTGVVSITQNDTEIVKSEKYKTFQVLDLEE